MFGHKTPIFSEKSQRQCILKSMSISGTLGLQGHDVSVKADEMRGLGASSEILEAMKDCHFGLRGWPREALVGSRTPSGFENKFGKVKKYNITKK